MMLAFLVAALLTFIVQSSSAVSVFGISLAAVGVISVDQAIMIMYGSLIGSSAIIYVLSSSLTGRSRCAVERHRPSAGANPARQLSLQPVAIGAGDGGNDMA